MKPLTSRDQYSSCARPDSISETGTTTWLTPPYVHSISAACPAVRDSAPVLVFLGLLESVRGTAQYWRFQPIQPTPQYLVNLLYCQLRFSYTVWTTTTFQGFPKPSSSDAELLEYPERTALSKCSGTPPAALHPFQPLSVDISSTATILQ